jgi:hypothetical protein
MRSETGNRKQIRTEYSGKVDKQQGKMFSQLSVRDGEGDATLTGLIGLCTANPGLDDRPTLGERPQKHRLP